MDANRSSLGAGPPGAAHPRYRGNPPGTTTTIPGETHVGQEARTSWRLIWTRASWKRSTNRIWRSVATTSSPIPPQGAFDVVHSRMGISHLPEREQVLRRMVGALKPGGWLVCEETDNISTTVVSPSDAASTALFMKIRDAITKAMAARGHVYNYGRHQLFGPSAQSASWTSGRRCGPPSES